jgi:competence protein ComEC
VRHVAAVPAIALIAGAACGLSPLVGESLLPAAVVLALAATAALSAWWLTKPLELIVSVGVAFFAGGAILAIDAWRDAWRPSLRVAFEELARQQRAGETPRARAWEDDSAFAVVSGLIRADAAQRPGGVSLSLDATRIERGTPPADHTTELAGQVRGGLLLNIGGTLAAAHLDEWRAGRLVRVPVLLRRPSRTLNPGVPDEERALARRGTTLVGSVKSGALVETLAKGGWLSESAASARAYARRSIAAGVGRWSGRSAAIVTAVIIGDRAGLEDAIETRLQEAGTYHVIAISGGNIAILASLALAGFRLAGVVGRTAMLTVIAALLAYAYLVGGGASVSRATLMAVVYFASRALDLRGPPGNVLACAAGALAAAQPLAVFDPGFLLTFAATVAILAAVPSVPRRSLPRLVVPLVAMLVASIAAEAALLPISAWIFSRVTIAGLALNFLAIPLMAVVQVAGMAVVLTSGVSPALASCAGWIAHAAAAGLVRSADLVAFVPMLAWRVAPPNGSVVAVYYLALVGAWALWRRRRLGGGQSRWEIWSRRASTAGACAAAIWIAGAAGIGNASGDGSLRVTFIDVGQGDAALVRFPRGATLLLDAGGLGGASSFDIGERVVAPVLRHAGIRRLESVAITHGDVDHAGGAASIVREFEPRDLWEGIPVPRLPMLQDLRKAAAEAGARWVNVQSGDLVTIDGVQIVARHPALPDWERQSVRNDDSIVLEMLWRDVSIVLTGDIGREVERGIAPLFAPSPLRVIKVPHHGSLTSSSREFIEALAPRVAVISVGRGNRFGHPAPEVVERYRQAGVQLFRTDRDGAIEVATDGYSLEVSTFMGQRVFFP